MFWVSGRYFINQIVKYVLKNGLILGQIYFIILLLSFGYILQYAKLSQKTPLILNKIVIYVSFPAAVLLYAPKIEFSKSILLPIITPWILLLVSIISVFILFKNTNTNTKAALLLLIPLGNTSFLGFPLIESVLSKDALQYAILYDQFGSFLMLSIYGTIVVSLYSHGKLNLVDIVKKIALFPPFIVLIYSIFIGYTPEVIMPLVKILASTLTPFAIISVGMTMKLRISEDRAIFEKALLLKLLIIPILVLSVFIYLDFNDIIAETTLLESAMPSMITAGILAANAGFAPRLSSTLIGYGIILSLITVPLFGKLFDIFI